MPAMMGSPVVMCRLCSQLCSTSLLLLSMKVYSWSGKPNHQPLTPVVHVQLQVIYNSYFLLHNSVSPCVRSYATIYTMAPVFSLVLDEDVSADIALMYPELYRDLAKVRGMHPSLCIYISV